ncbi:MAG: hypothetical protein HY909_13265, partial [Deltaproteobacteria bacterium]|nr:hypothetical protein [Deltaproteobacteria bacterium]
MGSERTAWHPLLVVLLRALLPRDAWDVVGEYQLTREPLRIDVVVLRRKHAANPPGALLPSLVAGLADHTLVHFKG